ncbi:electron transporter SenC [Opitutaceae bacterium TAV4]|nr:electron transporter SenC [Opitutaceae bacterium TAV4]RRJ99682.1 electron transporter SenC [Opitutaceae bacterium TAV3]
MTRKFLRITIALPVIALALATGCSRHEPAAAPSAETQTGGEKRHPLAGQVVSIDPKRGTLVVDHEEIPGYMPAMVMEFAVSPGDLANATEGRRLRAEMVEPEIPPEGDAPVFRLEKVWFADPVADARIASAADALRQDTAIRGRGVYREIGEDLPGFTLYNQNGEAVPATQFRGRFVVINFIYTRCPVATMCPASTRLMQSVQTKARAAGVDNLSLVSISLDPEYDTPGVLRDYAASHAIDTSNFSLLTGPGRAIKDLLNQFGVLADGRDGPLIKHTLSTLLIDPQGKIMWRTDGTTWSPDDFVARMKKGT